LQFLEIVEAVGLPRRDYDFNADAEE
jgi:hypothetical protein